MKLHQAAGRQVHQLFEVVVGADQVADDAALGGDDVYRRDLHGAAVADDVVEAGRARHLPGFVLCAPLAHVVEDDLGAPVGHLEHGVRVAFPALHRLVRAPLLSELEGLLAGIHDDYVRRRHRPEALYADVPQAPRADDDGVRARVEHRDGLPDRVVGGQARVGQRRDVLGLEGRVQLNDTPRAGPQKLGEAAVLGDAGERAVDALHVAPGAAVVAEAARHEGVADHGIPRLHVCDRRAYFFDPTRVLVPQDVGQQAAVRVLDGRPLALDDVDVRPAEPGGPYPDDHVEGAFDFGLVYLFDLEAVLGDAVVVPV